MKTSKASKYTSSNLLSTKDVCAILDISYPTLMRRIISREIKVLKKHGGKLYFSKKELNATFDNQLFS